MKYATVIWQGEPRVGRVDDPRIHFVETEGPVDEAGVATLIGRPVRETGESALLDEVRPLAPIPRPRRNVFCVGKNYHAHAAEFAASGYDASSPKGPVPDHPILFSKVPESVIGPDAPVIIDTAVSTAVDYEIELAVIVGRAGRCIPEARAMEHVWGYTILNDVTARDLQARHNQWLIGKSQDTFCPMGPWAVTADEIDLADCRVRLWINDELRQDANTAQLIFPVPRIIAALSNGITLRPGDIVATGTPEGVGIAFDPPRFLAAGDVMRLEIDGIGRLVNPVAAA